MGCPCAECGWFIGEGSLRRCPKKTLLQSWREVRIILPAEFRLKIRVNWEHSLSEPSPSGIIMFRTTRRDLQTSEPTRLQTV